MNYTHFNKEAISEELRDFVRALVAKIHVSSYAGRSDLKCKLYSLTDGYFYRDSIRKHSEEIEAAGEDSTSDLLAASLTLLISLCDQFPILSTAEFSLANRTPRRSRRS